MKMALEIGDSTFCKIGNLLSTSNELIQKILESLNYHDLLIAAKVSQNWLSVALNIIQCQRKLCYLTLHNPYLPTTEAKVAISGIGSSSLPIEEFLSSLTIQPSICLGFANDDWLHNPLYPAAHSSMQDDSLIVHLRQFLPQACQLFMVGARGVIGSVQKNSLTNINSNINTALRNALLPEESSDSTTSTEMGRIGSTSKEQNLIIPYQVGYSIEVEEESFGKENSALTLLLIPHQPKVKINVVHLDSKMLVQKSLSRAPEKMLTVTQDDFNGLCNLSPDDDVKALLLFDSHFDKYTELFLNAAVSRQNQKLALGGGYITEVQPGKGSYALVISGENVTAASIILSTSVKKIQAVEETLQKLKECGLPEEQSVAFLFSCCGRGNHWYKRGNKGIEDASNVETKAFRKLFPNTPIFGFFGDGEIGLNYLPKNGSVQFDDIPVKKSRKKLFHSYTSIIVLISVL